MRIITFCAHQPYLYLFAGMNLELDLIQLQEHRRFLQNWSDSVRPLPPGWRLVSWDEAKANLEKRRYQFAMAHNISDYIDFLPYKIPRILVVHTTLSSRLSEEKSNIDPEQYKKDLLRLLRKTRGRVVFVSRHKQNDWGLPGDVIPLAVDTDDYQGFTGEQARILRVSNQLIERGEILNYPAHCEITRGLDLTLVGHNPTIEGARTADSWEELKKFYRTHRAYLHTTTISMEDGYNTAMLEAMGTGMPILCTAHPTSPIIDGVNGFISDDLNYLHDKAKLLLSDHELARKLGAAARETTIKTFGIKHFQRAWRDVFKKAARRI